MTTMTSSVSSTQEIQPADIKVNVADSEVTISQESTADNGKQWSVFSLPGTLKNAIQNKMQEIKNGAVSCRNACTECCAETGNCCCKAASKCCGVKAITIGVITTVCGVLVIYGSVCVDQGRDGDPSYACSHNKYGHVSAIKNGAFMIAGGIFVCCLASGKVLVDKGRGR